MNRSHPGSRTHVTMTIERHNWMAAARALTDAYPALAEGNNE